MKRKKTARRKNPKEIAIKAIHAQLARLEKDVAKACKRLQALGQQTADNWRDWVKRVPVEEMFSLLNIPTKNDVAELKRRIERLEQKLR